MTLVSRLDRVREQIADAAVRSGRDMSAVTLVAVSKTVSARLIKEALSAGQRHFGENRAQEASVKAGELAGEDLTWHFVGRLQRNKVKSLTPFVSVIHSIDRLELAEEVSKRFESPVEVLIEVNTSGEPEKGGVEPKGVTDLAGRLLEMSGVRLTGLMTMVPIASDPNEARRYFRQLAGLRGALNREFPSAGIQQLSMGMSQDYVVAVEEGATMVRIGEAIFGPRPRLAIRGRT